MRTIRGTRLIAILLAALVAAACGGDDGEDTTAPTATPTTAPVETESSEPGPQTVSVYFADESQGDVCTEAFPLDREITTDDPVEGALVALLAGPTEDEAAEGYTSWFSDETADLLEEVTVEDGRALVSFDPSLPEVIPNASTSCGSGALLAQLDATTTQFPEVDEAWYALGGDRDAFYQWLQMVTPE